MGGLLPVLRATVLAIALATAAGVVFAHHKLRIVTTSADLKSLVEVVGGGRVDVHSLAAPEQDPYIFEVKPAQLAKVRAAALVVRIGLDHEPWLGRLKLPADVTVLDVSKSARLIQTQAPRLRGDRRAQLHVQANSHYWLDPQNALAITTEIRDALVRLSPTDAAHFDANRAAFADALERRIREWRAALIPFRGEKLVVMHDGWSYFAEAFGLTVVAAAEPNRGVPPPPAELPALFTRMREEGVRLVVADPSSNPALLRQISEKSGARAVILHPSGHDYIRLLDENVSRLAAALKRSAR